MRDLGYRIVEEDEVSPAGCATPPESSLEVAAEDVPSPAGCATPPGPFIVFAAGLEVRHSANATMKRTFPTVPDALRALRDTPAHVTDGFTYTVARPGDIDVTQLGILRTKPGAWKLAVCTDDDGRGYTLLDDLWVETAEGRFADPDPGWKEFCR